MKKECGSDQQDNRRDCSCECRKSFRCRPINRVPATIRIQKVDATTGAPLAGAVFTATDPLGNTFVATSNAVGHVQLLVPAGRTYLVVETTPPPGYVLNPTSYVATVLGNREVFINGEFTPILTVGNIAGGGGPGTLSVLLIDAISGTPLEGGFFTLTGDTQVITEATGADGVALFGLVPTGTYTLAQIAAPVGYTLNPQTYQVIVDANGNLTVDGAQVPATGFVITNTIAG
ncbi:hypothetical protein JCM19046_2832 [Bacillus sp. JCM 19046]|nr:hypothetical protein JCM19045_1629 [Bacillus sp. JCM 19045]GAF18268.1 hypothetical protein JCM19046_2832 [Bacillus sp. JCM 19046]